MSFNGKYFEIEGNHLSYKDTYTHQGLSAIDRAFLNSIESENIITAIRNGELVDSEQLIELSLVLESWLIDLYGIRDEYTKWQANWRLQDPLSGLKQLFFTFKGSC